MAALPASLGQVEAYFTRSYKFNQILRDCKKNRKDIMYGTDIIFLSKVFN